jgi:hypothetical protein
MGMKGFDGEGWPWTASRGALPPLTMEHKIQSAEKNTWIPVPQAALTAAPLAA